MGASSETNSLDAFLFTFGRPASAYGECEFRFSILLICLLRRNAAELASDECVMCTAQCTFTQTRSFSNAIAIREGEE